MQLNSLSVSTNGVGISDSDPVTEIINLKAEEFGGEYEKRNSFYVLFLWIFSILAMITNISRAFRLKFFSGKNVSIKKILWDMGRDKRHFSGIFLDRFSRYNHRAKCDAASWRALDLFYNYHEKVLPRLKNDIEGKMTQLWMGKMENRQAIANRKKIVGRLLKKEFLKFSGKSEVRIVSIASGSAQAVIEVMKECLQLNIKAILIDVDRSALKEAEELVEMEGLKGRFSFVRGTPRKLKNVCKEFKPHIIEMVGFLDYLPEKKAIELISEIKGYLSEGGTFITCNIRKNREKIFLDWVLLWPMIYRNERQFSEVLIQGGFLSEKIRVIYEPFRIHGIAVCKK